MSHPFKIYHIVKIIVHVELLCTEWPNYWGERGNRKAKYDLVVRAEWYTSEIQDTTSKKARLKREMKKVALGCESLLKIRLPW